MCSVRFPNVVAWCGAITGEASTAASTSSSTQSASCVGQEYYVQSIQKNVLEIQIFSNQQSSILSNQDTNQDKQNGTCDSACSSKASLLIIGESRGYQSTYHPMKPPSTVHVHTSYCVVKSCYKIQEWGDNKLYFYFVKLQKWKCVRGGVASISAQTMIAPGKILIHTQIRYHFIIIVGLDTRILLTYV